MTKVRVKQVLRIIRTRLARDMSLAVSSWAASGQIGGTRTLISCKRARTCWMGSFSTRRVTQANRKAAIAQAVRTRMEDARYTMWKRESTRASGRSAGALC